AGRHATKEGTHRPARERGEQRIQLSELLQHDAHRARPESVLHQGLLRRRGAAEPEAEDGGDRGGRRGVRPAGLPRRARKCQGDRPHRRLRSKVSIGNYRPRAGGAGDGGDQSGPRHRLLLSARLGRHGAGGQRGRLQAENDRWCHGRPAEHGDQGSARSAAQRLDQLRLLAAGSEDAVCRRGRLDEEVPSARGGRGRGCARLLHAAVGLFPATGPPAGGCSTTRLDSAQLGDYIRANTFKTVVGDVRFGRNGEWARSRMLQVQFQNVKTNDLTQFKDISTQVVAPTEYESGKLIYPYEKALASSP